jgi:hypothetical protein
MWGHPAGLPVRVNRLSLSIVVNFLLSLCRGNDDVVFLYGTLKEQRTWSGLKGMNPPDVYDAVYV